MSNAVENGGGPAGDENGGTVYYFSRPRTGASLAQRMRIFFSIYWKSILVILTPILLLPIPIQNEEPRFRCMYVVLIMAIYWVFELLPLPVTSMLPIVLFPTMGILNSDKTTAAYMKETNIMFMGGLMIAAGVQHSKLPKRVALWTVQVVGCSHRRLNFGLTFVTMFISMWVSNAAATTMMVPIVEAILEVLEQQGLGDVYINRKKNTNENGKENGKQVNKASEDEPPIPSNITICYYLSIAYASTLGGCGTLVGTATNSAFKGIFDSEFPESTAAVDFFRFMVYSTPPMIIMQLLVWVSLQVTFMGMFRPNSEAAKKVALAGAGSSNTMKVIKENYRSLGPATFHEKASGALFLLAVFMYIFRKPGFMLGWADVMTSMKVKDGVVSMFIVILMFILPMALDFLKIFSASSSYEELSHLKPSQGIVTWNVLKEKVPWGLMFLLGGGFALAEGSKATGLSSMIGDSLIGLKGLPDLVVLLVVVLVTQFITEFTSNVAIANLILPVLANMARTLDMDPRFLMVPATLACSMAFHMPVGTPPNAIVAGVAHIPTSRMVRMPSSPALDMDPRLLHGVPHARGHPAQRHRGRRRAHTHLPDGTYAQQPSAGHGPSPAPWRSTCPWAPRPTPSWPASRTYPPPGWYVCPAAQRWTWTLACSMAFHMPVGTPPNAIVAGVAHIPTSRMVRMPSSPALDMDPRLLHGVPHARGHPAQRHRGRRRAHTHLPDGTYAQQPSAGHGPSPAPWRSTCPWAPRPTPSWPASRTYPPPGWYVCPAAQRWTWTLACSMAFHMPVGTPPNAIVAGVAHIPTSRMAVGGIGPKIISTLIVWGAYPTWGRLMFSADQMGPVGNNTTNTHLNTTLLLACHTLVSDFNQTSPVNCAYNSSVPAALSTGFFKCNYKPN
ncbi:hypothetical protein O0L34_g14952 [Tuta absoluta]|nr:hypothetical protein O0L34_g14952 [Tuta absoluta]